MALYPLATSYFGVEHVAVLEHPVLGTALSIPGVAEHAALVDVSLEPDTYTNGWRVRSDFGFLGFLDEVEAAEYPALERLKASSAQPQTIATVEVVDGGTRQEYLSAMAEGGDQAPLITPDYTGALLLHLTDDGARNPSVTEAPTPSVSAAASGAASASGGPTPTPTGLNVQGMSPGDISSTVDRVLPRQLSTLDPASAENRDALVVTRATAAKYELSSISDLAAHCGQLRFGTPPGFAERSYGTAGLRRLYDCSPGRYVEQSDPSRLVDELADATVDVADIPTASAAIGQNGFVVLEDPQADFIAQQVVPVVRADTLPSSAVDALNTVSGKLSTSDLTFLDQLMSGPDAVSAQDAAAFWVQEGTD